MKPIRGDFPTEEAFREAYARQDKKFSSGVRAGAVTLETEGLAELFDSFREISDKFPEWLEQFVNSEAKNIVNVAKFITPIKTGDLAKGWVASEIKSVGDGFEVRITNDAKDKQGRYYSYFTEYGHRLVFDGHGWVNGIFVLTKLIRRTNQSLPSSAAMSFENFLLGVKW